MPSKKIDVISVGGYSKFKNCFTFLQALQGLLLNMTEKKGEGVVGIIAVIQHLEARQGLFFGHLQTFWFFLKTQNILT